MRIRLISRFPFQKSADRMKIPSTYDLKPAFQRLLSPVMERLHAWGVTPNGLTWMAIVLSGGLGAAFVQGLSDPRWFWMVVVGLLVRMMLNALDGMMARQYGMTSKAGAVLNELGDVVSDALVMWPLALLPGMHWGWVGALLWLSAVNEFAGILGSSIGTERRYEGPMGKSDRTLIWGVLCIGLGLRFDVTFGLMPAVYVVLACLVWSTWRRIKKTLSDE